MRRCTIYLRQSHAESDLEKPSCGIGELTRALAPRCRHIVASDFSARAVGLATERCGDLANVRIERRTLPQEWPRPEERFDLVVLSEFGYFLDESDMSSVARCCDETLTADGTLVACDWLAPFDGRRLSTRRVHEVLASIGLPPVACYVDDDFLMSIWCREPSSVAARDGIR